MSDPFTSDVDPWASGGGGQPSPFTQEVMPGVFRDRNTGAYFVWEEGPPIGMAGLPSEPRLRQLTSAERVQVEQQLAQVGATGGGGLTFDEQMALRRTPTTNISQSLADPRSLALQEQGIALQERGLAQAHDQFLLGQQQQHEQFLRSQEQRLREHMDNLRLQQEQLGLSAAALDEQMRAARVQETFLQDKFDFESGMDMRREARETQNQLFNQQATLAQMDIQKQGLIHQAQQVNAQLQHTTNQFNATMQFQADLENQRREEAQQQRRERLAGQIGELSRDPGDRGALAAFLLANPGMDALDARLADGESFVTDDSLVPLESSLAEMEDARRGFQRVEAERIAAPQVGMPQFTPFQMPDMDAFNAQFPMPEPRRGGDPAPVTAPATGTPDPVAHAQQVLGRDRILSDPTGQGVTTEQLANIDFHALGELHRAGQTQGFEDGGHARGMFVAGDSSDGKENREIVIPLGPGEALVIPEDKAGGFLRRMNKAEMQEGGLFDQGSLFEGLLPSVQNTDRSRAFLQEATERAMRGTPWQGQRAPTPVEVSAPGTDPVVQQLAAALQAMSSGLPAETFLRRMQMQTPIGVNEGQVRRTA